MDISSPCAASTIDSHLVTRVVKGEQLAFHQLYDQSSPILYSMALRILGSRNEAEEVLQGIYLDIWKKVVRYDVGRGTPIAWLITLTRSRAVDRLRTRGPRAPRQSGSSSGDVQTSQTADRNSNPFDSPADQELRNLITQSWAHLPLMQQQAVEMAYYEGLPDTEIASQLNQPVEVVRTCITLGLSQLREALHMYWEQDEAG
ncbi:MAG: sigma-70 family RNA polymerase sigma factor [Nitrospira sp.]